MHRKTWNVLTVLALVLGALAFAATSSAHDGHHDGDHHGESHHGDHHGKQRRDGDNNRFTYDRVTTDQGCLDHVWANDTLKRTYRVHKTESGAYKVSVFDRGSFLTVAGVSPQGCPTGVDNDKHGTVVTAGIKGHVIGFLTTTVTGGTYNPKGVCPTDCGRDAFIAAFFGPTATSSCDAAVATDCKYVYVFHSSDPTLKYRTWIDSGKADHDGPLVTRDRGDIATA